MKVRNNDHYTYRVTWSENDQEFVGLCAEFPSLSWLASSQESALRGIRSGVAQVVTDMKTNREAIPEPLAGPLAASSWLEFLRRFIAVYSHSKKLPYCSGEMTCVLLNDINGELWICTRDAGFRPGSGMSWMQAEPEKTPDPFSKPLGRYLFYRRRSGTLPCLGGELLSASYRDILAYCL